MIYDDWVDVFVCVWVSVSMSLCVSVSVLLWGQVGQVKQGGYFTSGAKWEQVGRCQIADTAACLLQTCARPALQRVESRWDDFIFLVGSSRHRNGMQGGPSASKHW